MANPTTREYEAACAVNNAEILGELLSRSPNPRALYYSSNSHRMDGLALQNYHNAIPVVARYLPDVVNEYNGAGMTAFHHAAKEYSTQSLQALAACGASVRALTRPQAPGELAKDAMRLACTELSPAHGNSKTEHLLTLRRLGLSPNVADERGRTAFSDVLVETPIQRIKDLLHIGANIYDALRLSPPDDPLHPDMEALKSAFVGLYQKPGRTTDTMFELLKREITTILHSAPRPPITLNPHLFVQRNGEPNTQALHWEAVSILPTCFAPEAIPRWKGGLGEMVETAGRMPLYMQNSVNLPRLQREMPGPRAESVTASYISGTAHQQGV